MPWLRSRTERSSGLTTWSLEWREGKKVRHRVLGPITEHVGLKKTPSASGAEQGGRGRVSRSRAVATLAWI